MAWLSLLALYNWDNKLFEQMQLPDKVDKTTFVNNLLLDTAELEVIYPDPDILKAAIGAWSAARMHTWEKICQVLYLEYDPLINIRRDEVRTIKSTGASTSSGSSVDQVSAWNDTDFANRGKTDDSGKTDTSHETTETLHIEGDSAITDAQDVIKKEMDVRIKYDMYKLISQEFKERFCLLVY